MQRKYQITGMSCAACSARVTKAVSKIDGVKNVNVALLNNSLTLDCSEDFNDEIIIKAVTDAGYGAATFTQDELVIEEDKKEAQAQKFNLFICIALTLVMVAMSLLHMAKIDLIENAFVFASIHAIFAIVIMILEKKYFISAIKALKHGGTNMDTLVSIGALASFIFSIYSMLNISLEDTISVLFNEHPIYFEGVAGILTFVSVGKYLESQGKVKTTSALNALYELAPKQVEIKKGDEIKTIALSDVKIDDVLILKQGQKLGIDGIVVKGTGHMDESALTGESYPVKVAKGSVVHSATLLKDGYLEVKATSVGENTVLGKIIKLVEATANKKVPLARIADRLASVFVPIVIIIALATFCTWYFLLNASFASALEYAISVLVISCPCALGLATPVAVMAGTGRAAKAGVIFKDPEALEGFYHIDSFVFDKTGTLTKGQMSLNQILIKDTAYSENEILKIAASLEQKSSHPIAVSITNAYEGSKLEVLNYEYLEGIAVKGEILDKEYYLGNSKLLSITHTTLDNEAKKQIEILEQSGALVLNLVSNNKLIALIVIADTLKEDSKKLIEALKKNNLHTLMLSGDNNNICKYIANKLGLEDFKGELLPNDKAEYVKKLQENGHKVAMIGDGINDSVSLTQANIGIGLKGSSDIAIKACDVILLKEHLIDVFNAYLISKATINNIKQNLFWALIYNVICIPVAIGCYSGLGIKLSPMLASILMGLSSVCVVTNALRLSFMKVIESNEPSRARIIENNKEDKVMEKTITIEGMACKHCVANVTRTLEALEGVAKAEVSLESKSAKISLNNELSDAVIKTAIEDAGYEVVAIK